MWKFFCWLHCVLLPPTEAAVASSQLGGHAHSSWHAVGRGLVMRVALCVICRIVIIDEADSWSRQLLEDGVIERFIPFDFSDQETVFERCMTVIRRIEKVWIPGLLGFDSWHWEGCHEICRGFNRSLSRKLTSVTSAAYPVCKLPRPYHAARFHANHRVVMSSDPLQRPAL